MVTIKLSLTDLDALIASLRFAQLDNDTTQSEWLAHRLEAAAQFGFHSGSDSGSSARALHS